MFPAIYVDSNVYIEKRTFVKSLEGYKGTGMFCIAYGGKY